MKAHEELVYGYSLLRQVSAKVFKPKGYSELTRLLQELDTGTIVSIAGGRQSYFDCFMPDVTLEGNVVLIDMSKLKQIFEIDTQNSTLRVSAGFTISEILIELEKMGRSLCSIPGTGQLTIGGAIATNVHGKDSWSKGNFNAQVQKMLVANRQGKVKEIMNPQVWFNDGNVLGLDYCLLEVTLSLTDCAKNSSVVETRKIPFKNIEEGIDLLLQSRVDWNYLVAWVDCIHKSLFEKRASGRGVLSVARRIDDVNQYQIKRLQREVQPRSRILGLKPEYFWRVVSRFYLPALIRLVNSAIYRKAKFHGTAVKREEFFEWNFVHNKIPKFNYIHYPNGFYEIQIFARISKAKTIIREILNYCETFDLQSELCAIKIHPRSDSIATPGYVDEESISFGIDISKKRFKKGNSTDVLETFVTFLNRLGTNVYLTKDAILSGPQVRLMYPRLYEKLCRSQSNLPNVFWSAQFSRLIQEKEL